MDMTAGISIGFMVVPQGVYPYFLLGLAQTNPGRSNGHLITPSLHQIRSSAECCMRRCASHCVYSPMQE